jgi:hypothetical protein
LEVREADHLGAWSVGNVQVKVNVAEGVEGDIEGAIICFPQEIMITGVCAKASLREPRTGGRCFSCDGPWLTGLGAFAGL